MKKMTNKQNIKCLFGHHEYGRCWEIYHMYRQGGLKKLQDDEAMHRCIHCREHHPVYLQNCKLALEYEVERRKMWEEIRNGLV